MYLPASSASAALPDLVIAIQRSEIGGWSSLIGVVSAIIGNILISFALNTQRYAHLRLSRDKEAARQEKRRAAKKRSLHNYGTTTPTNGGGGGGGGGGGKHDGKDYALGRRIDNDETRPLMSRSDSPSSTLASSQQDEKDDEEPKEKSYLQSPIWWVGIGLMVTGEIGNFLAYGFAPASIVSPLGVVALISNCLIAPLLLGEKFRWRDAIGVLIAVGGCVVVVLSASDSNPKLTPKAIWHLVTRWEFETYLGVTCGLIVVLMLASNKFGEKTILIDIGLVGLFGGYTALSTKGVASLLTYSIWRVVTFPITYLLVAVLVSTAIMQIKYINRALQRFNATMVIPTQFVMFTISVIVGSAVLYRDFERQTPEDGIKFGCGCALTFFGVWCITSGRKKDGDEQDARIEEEDEESLLDAERAMSEIRDHEGGDAARQTSVAVSSDGAPSIRRYHSADVGSLPKSLAKVPTFNTPVATKDVDVQPLADQVHDMQPANESAVHVESAAPLLQHTDPNKRPPLHATTSAPMQPTTSNSNTALRPKTPLTRTPTGPAESPARASPSRTQSSAAPRLLSRRSAVGLFPSALTSPLSGSLSAIVADELRRGIDRSPLANVSMARRRSAKGTNPPRRATNEYGDTRPDLTQGRPAHSKTKSMATGGTLLDFEQGTTGLNINGRRPSTAMSDVFNSGAGASSLKKQRTWDVQTSQNLAPAFEEEDSRNS
ncbi:uncharacterized protein RCC_07840 [Ramularia collo-cygni]|uniref:DUF803 domain membrane protein n=1 Tax=Ramularia collo-cygni TaxID=112498 RepID=A0A2D3UW16_9PEZI|nr:uncharacterized protein RCC_07840 [Ramularia collo-cygni]CZT21972.1 uncharacterized protein RCC_07840 [Ramularia collo-cygni]